MTWVTRATALGALKMQLGMTVLDSASIGGAAPGACGIAGIDAGEPPVQLRVDPARAADGSGSRLKRQIDFVAAGAALLFLAPFLLLVALAIFVETGGPVLFRQPRCGLGGATFRIVKFRTMYVDSSHDERQAERNDPRVTRVGSVLRKLSIDELPQLMNVVRGEMSLVGPRPHALSHDAAWAASVPNYTGRYRTRPGLTGLAQVLGHRGLVTCADDIMARVAADNAYIDRWSIYLDLTLIARTLPLLFGDPKAH